MGTFDVYIFLTNCFIGRTVSISDKEEIVPFEGIGSIDVITLIENFLHKELGQPLPPQDVKEEISQKISQEGASTILIVRDIVAVDCKEAIRSTEEPLLLLRDILTTRQLQRGHVAGFFTMQTDVNPYQLYYTPRRPYPLLKRITHLPIYEGQEADIFTYLARAATKSPLFRVYLSLYADTTALSDSIVTEIGQETRLFKLWSLLEAMAQSESGTKKAKVKALFHRYKVDLHPNYLSHGRDLIDLVYDWRNIVAHCGSSNAVTDPKDLLFCQTYKSEFSQMIDDFDWQVRFLLESFANSA